MIPPDLRKDVDDLKKRVAWLEHEFQALENRIRSETNNTIHGMLAGIENMVGAHTQSMQEQVAHLANEFAETRKQVSKIDDILKIVQRIEVREKAEELLKERELEEEATFSRKLELAGKVTDIQVKKAAFLDSRIDGSHKRKIAVWTLVVGVITTLLGGGIWSIFSHLAK